MGAPRLTYQTRVVLRILLESASEQQYGLEIARRAGLPSGTIYPILARLETAGWLASGWENIDEALEGRRKRRYYQLTGLGAREASAVIAETKLRMFPDLSGVTS